MPIFHRRGEAGGKHVAAGEGRMSPSTGGEGRNIYRYAYVIAYKLCNRIETEPGQQEKEGCPVTETEREDRYRYAYIIVYKLKGGGEGGGPAGAPPYMP